MGAVRSPAPAGEALHHEAAVASLAGEATIVRFPSSAYTENTPLSVVSEGCNLKSQMFQHATRRPASMHHDDRGF
jgi:hypothetical protein